MNETAITSDAPAGDDGVKKVVSTEKQTIPVPPPVKPEQWLSPGQWGMLAFLLSEVALFSTLIVVYINFLSDPRPPRPGQVLALPLVIVTTTLLLSSSVTIHFAEKALHHGGEGKFKLWWALTIALGVSFLLGTAYEWWELIDKHGLTISRNLFGTAYYTLVGFHAMHVTGGVITMSIILGLALAGRVTAASRPGVELVSWYWHFVDAVWVVVFTVVYIVGR